MSKNFRAMVLTALSESMTKYFYRLLWITLSILIGCKVYICVLTLDIRILPLVLQICDTLM